MYKTAWNVTFEKKIDFQIENLNFVESLNVTGTYTYFFYWKTYKKTSIDLLKELQEKAWARLVNHDISISCEDEIEIYSEKQVEGVYTIISIEWSKETFKTVVDKFIESSPFILCIRETESSPRFWNRIIKIDIVSY